MKGSLFTLFFNRKKKTLSADDEAVALLKCLTITVQNNVVSNFIIYVVWYVERQTVTCAFHMNLSPPPHLPLPSK